jgi:hypothetical protein
MIPTNGRKRFDLDNLKGTPWVAKRHLIDSVVIEPLITDEAPSRPPLFASTDSRSSIRYSKIHLLYTQPASCQSVS